MISQYAAPASGACFACLWMLLGANALCQSPSAPPSLSPQAAANGALPEYIEEFFLSEAVRSEEHNELQLTLQGMAFHGRGSSLDGDSVGIDTEYGITGRLQFGLEAPFGIQSTPTGETPTSWSAANLSLLYQFIRGNHPFALSGVMGVNTPLTSRGQLSYDPELLVAKAFGTLQIHTSLIPDLGGGDTSLEYNVAAVRPFTRHWIPTLEFNGRRNSGLNSFYVTPGIYRHLPHRFEMGIATPAGIGRFSSPVGAVFKMTWEVGGDKDD